MRDPRVLVQDPPVGKFTFDNLLFTKKPRSTGKVAYIPRDRFEDLKPGQGEKESCHGLDNGLNFSRSQRM